MTKTRQNRRLTSNQWKALQELFHELQSKDRAIINSYITQYWYWKRKFSQRQNPPETKLTLNKLKGHLQKFLDDVGNADEDVTAALLNPALNAVSLEGLGSPWQPTIRRLSFDGINEMQELIQRYIRWMEKAAGHVNARKTGPETGDVAWLVCALDGLIFARTGKHITRSTKRGSLLPFIKMVFKIADSEAGPGAIDGAIKAYIRRNRPKWTSQ